MLWRSCPPRCGASQSGVRPAPRAEEQGLDKRPPRSTLRSGGNERTERRRSGGALFDYAAHALWRSTATRRIAGVRASHGRDIRQSKVDDVERHREDFAVDQSPLLDPVDSTRRRGPHRMERRAGFSVAALSWRLGTLKVSARP